MSDLSAVVDARARCRVCGKYGRPVVRRSLSEVAAAVGVSVQDVLVLLRSAGGVCRSGRWLLSCEVCGV